MTWWAVPATVIRVIDGDTLKLELDLGWHMRLTANCRVAGVDAPELGTPEGTESRAFVMGLLPVGAAVTFVSHSLDKYGRPLGSVVLANGEVLGELLIAMGYARSYP